MSSSPLGLSYLQIDRPRFPVLLYQTLRACSQIIARVAWAVLRDLGQVLHRFGQMIERKWNQIFSPSPPQIREQSPIVIQSEELDSSMQADLAEKLAAFKNIPRDTNEMFLQSVIEFHRLLMTPSELADFNSKLKEQDPNTFLVVAGWAVRTIVFSNEEDPLPSILPVGQYETLSRIALDPTKTPLKDLSDLIHYRNLSDVLQNNEHQGTAWRNYLIEEINGLAQRMSQGNPPFFIALSHCR